MDANVALAGIVTDHAYHQFAGKSEEETREWHAFMLFLVREHGGIPTFSLPVAMGTSLPKPERVVLVDPSVIGCLGAAWIGHARELRSRQRIERPAFGTMLARRGRAVQDLALTAVEAGKMTARQRRPDDAWLSISMPRGE